MECKNSVSVNGGCTAAGGIRKYLVLLQDCLAIKFVPLFPANTSQSKGERVRKSVQEDGRRSSEEANANKPSFATTTDQSLKGLFLYKEFVEVNLQCYWNSSLHETIKSLEYKGTVVPSTILLGFPIRKHMQILKTAWARKMLKSPKGYRIEFAGEIEELIADPIEKSHFIPLSDSLCWAIHELTSSGQEAFVDSILKELSSTFPETVVPPKELIYQVLERLTKDKKVYQTAQGYFVVSPDTYRYIVNTDPLSIINQSSQEESRLLSCSPHQVFNEKDEEIEEREDFQPSPVPLGRSNSLRPKRNDRMSGCLPRRTFSMRSSNKNRQSRDSSAYVPPNLRQSRVSLRGSLTSLEVNPTTTNNDPVLSRRRKHKSFLRKLLTFRRSKKSPRKEKTSRNPNPTKSQKSDEKNQKQKHLTISTQTSHSIENLPSSFGLLSVSDVSRNLNSSPLRKTEMDDSDSGRYTESSSPHSEADIILEENSNKSNLSSPGVGLQVKIDEDAHESPSPSATRGSSTPSTSFTCNNSPLLTSSPSPSSLNSGNSGTSDKWHLNSNSNGPPSRSSSCSVSSISSYRDLYNSYRRKSNSYHQNPNQSHAHTLPPTGLVHTHLSSKPPSGSGSGFQNFKYPPRPFEKKAIYERMSSHNNNTLCHFNTNNRTPSHLQTNNKNSESPIRNKREINMSTSMNQNQNSSSRSTKPLTTSTTTTTSVSGKTSTNLELELLLPLGKLISAALTDFENFEKNQEKIPKEISEQNKPKEEEDATQDNKTTVGNSTKNTNTKKTLDEELILNGQGPAISQVKSKTVNDLFTIKSFLKLNNSNNNATNANGFMNSSSSGGIEFTTEFNCPGQSLSNFNHSYNYNSKNNINTTRNTLHNKSDNITSNTVEAVSFNFKPHHFDHCRESEII